MAELTGTCVKRNFHLLPPASLIFFAVLFFLNLAAGLFVMLVLPHLFPAGHLGQGLFIGDSTSIHEGAVQIREAWRMQGWSDRLVSRYPSAYGWFVAAVYRVMPAHPLSFLPIQAASMALAGTIFYHLLLKFSFSRLASLGGAAWLALNPQTFEWSTQLLKDGIFFAAIFLCFSALFSERPIHAFLLCLAGCLLLLIVRPHWLRVLMAVMLLMILALGILSMFGRKRAKSWVAWPSAGITLLLPILFYFGIKKTPEPYHRMFVSYEVVNQEARLSSPALPESSALLPPWRPLQPAWLNNVFFEIYNLRLERIKIGGHSIMDETSFLNSLPNQLGYLPRALQIGLFAPFPAEIWRGIPDGRRSHHLEKIRTWPQEGLGRKTTGLAREFMPWLTLLCTLALLGVAFAIADSQKRSGVVWLMLFCLPQLALLAMVCPNLGTLVRLRYPFYAPLVCIGLAAWVDWLRSRGRSPGFHS